jgi:hypothetical protein
MPPKHRGYASDEQEDDHNSSDRDQDQHSASELEEDYGAPLTAQQRCAGFSFLLHSTTELTDPLRARQIGNEPPFTRPSLPSALLSEGTRSSSMRKGRSTPLTRWETRSSVRCAFALPPFLRELTFFFSPSPLPDRLFEGSEAFLEDGREGR